MVVIINKDATKEDVEKALKKMDKAIKKKPRLADFAGKLKGFFGDGLAYQKSIRNEWD
jgi:hypothetical protein